MKLKSKFFDKRKPHMSLFVCGTILICLVLNANPIPSQIECQFYILFNKNEFGLCKEFYSIAKRENNLRLEAKRNSSGLTHLSTAR